MIFTKEIVLLIEKLEGEENFIDKKRKRELKNTASIVKEHLESTDKAEITVICTHNSRRSQLGQLWIKVAAIFHGIPNVYTFSGGTESTAFNHRMVRAIKMAGFEIKKLSEGENPKYHIKLSEGDESMDILYSKKYNESYNPQSAYIGIMVCDHADENCPIVFGAKDRISLPYLDPKAFDDTDLEAEKYSEKVREIGREMLYMFKSLKNGEI